MNFRLTRRLAHALDSGTFDGLAGCDAADEADRLCALLTIYDLWLEPIERVAGRVRFQNHPAIAELKIRLEEPFIESLDESSAWTPTTPADVSVDLRRIARGTDDSIYDWVATSADWEQLVSFLAIEGGPDALFDDLVALCQVGIRGLAKVTLGANYWDEMGQGDPTQVHTLLHERLVEAVGLVAIRRDELPVPALQRSALNGLLATNRWLQPEMVGALGLLELQAGPRCRQVVRGLRRLGAPAGAFPFYEEHANVDPLHGKAWLDDAVRPLVDDHPNWAARIVRGARWRAAVNDRFFADVHRALGERSLYVA
ncbi:MAG: iron-containing redox enzyme family protein [Acidimicrobiia bacterium]|nr:iron-containing redox enzyme family protein [Acidimicrobiia bacterium]